MAALAHGCALVTTTGALTEAFWAHDNAAILVPAEDPDCVASAVAGLCADPTRRAELGARAAELYRRRFDVAHTVNTLRRTA